MDAKLMTQLDAELMAEIGREIERMEDLIHDLRAENKRLRKALNLIANSQDIRFGWPRGIAKEALK